MTASAGPATVGVPRAVVERILRARSVLTICHERPEADALGAALGVALAVEQLGARAVPVCADPVPEMYHFLRGMERFRGDPEGERFDLIVVVDCGELARVGPVLERHPELFGSVPIVNIDHHRSNTGFGEVDWVDPIAAAACEQVTLLAQALGVPLTAADGTLAAALLAGIVIDTATFQHPNATPRTLRVAADLPLQAERPAEALRPGPCRNGDRGRSADPRFAHRGGPRALRGWVEPLRGAHRSALPERDRGHRPALHRAGAPHARKRAHGPGRRRDRPGRAVRRWGPPPRRWRDDRGTPGRGPQAGPRRGARPAPGRSLGGRGRGERAAGAPRGGEAGPLGRRGGRA